MKKHYYAVAKGRTVGIFKSWESCKDSVNGYAGANYCGFGIIEDAYHYLEEQGIDNVRIFD